VPTFDRLALFKREYRRLTPEQQARFKVAVAKLIAALSQTPPRVPGEPLVNPLAGHRGVYELVERKKDGGLTVRLDGKRLSGLWTLVPARLGAAGAIVNDPDTAFSFGGSGYIKDSLATAVGADFTIEAWVKPSSSNQSAPVVSIGVNNGTRTLSLEGNRFAGKTDLSSAWPSY